MSGNHSAYRWEEFTRWTNGLTPKQTRALLLGAGIVAARNTDPERTHVGVFRELLRPFDGALGESVCPLNEWRDARPWLAFGTVDPRAFAPDVSDVLAWLGRSFGPPLSTVRIACEATIALDLRQLTRDRLPPSPLICVTSVLAGMVGPASLALARELIGIGSAHA